MNILHLVAGDLSGGAARGALWLHEALLEHGACSQILTNSRNVTNYRGTHSIVTDSVTRVKGAVRCRLDLLPTWFYRNRKKIIFSPGLTGYDFTKTQHYEQADIIHLHWINAGFVNLRHLSKVDKPIIWTMRDMWPMTGGCHYAIGCDNYQKGCGWCKELASNVKNDLSRFVLWRKKKNLQRNMKIVGISTWLSECATKSELFRNFDVRTISNNINSSDFKPIEKHIARDVLDLPENSKIVLAGAQSFKEVWKGFDLYLKALQYLSGENIFLLFFGKIDEVYLGKLGFGYKNLGFLHDTTSLRLAYSAADVFVAPSSMEAFGKTIGEAMSCGTPVVCFDATGPKDIVSHKVDGYKAVPFESEDLAYGIEWVINNRSYNKLCKNARDKIVKKFDSKIIAKEYIGLYNGMVK